MAQPPPSRISLRAILSLPYRLCNPPPAVGKVRSCSFTPVFDVRLDDVLARRHLPPIGLKDFEEYLLYVEHTPENLYFLLWLKEYTARYHAWAQREKTDKKKKMTSNAQHHKYSLPPTPDPALAMFYMRAKQTFFTPMGAYELNIPSDVLAPFHASPHAHSPHPHPRDHSRSSLWHSQSVHPDPAVFAEVAVEARGMLNESLRRFVRAAYTNVGSQRAACGITAGCLFTLVAGALPLLLTTGRWNIGPHGRLIRLVAFPGLWFGLTVLIASLQGICLMVYIFGDLRQLRRFELTRPTISRPMPLPISSPTPYGSTRTPSQSLYIPSRRAPRLPEKSTGTISSFESPSPLVAPTRPRAQFSDVSLPGTSCESCESEVCTSVECNEIDISPAYFDDVPAPEGPATASCLYRPEYRLPPPSAPYLEPVQMPVRADIRPGRASISGSTPGSPVEASGRSLWTSTKGLEEYGPTAGFIPSDNRSSTSVSDVTRSLRSHGNPHGFDFDLLPPSRVGQYRCSTGGGDGAPPFPSVGGANGNVPPTSTVVVDPSSPHSYAASSPTLTGVGSFIGRTQYKCNQRTMPVPPDSPPTKGTQTRFRLTMLIPSFTAGVPAFASPLTPVHSPVVKRAQWEVVVRAAFSGAVIAGVLTGVVTGVAP